MKRLTKQLINDLEGHAAELHTAFEQMEKDYSILEDMINDYNKHIDEFNAKLADARIFVSGVVEEMNNFKDERSEKWEESDAGGEYTDWMGNWEEIELEDVSNLDMPENPTDTPASAIPDALRELPREPG